MSRATGISEDTVGRGIKELADGARLETGQVRRRGAGRPALTVSDPTLVEDLKRLVDPDTRGDPESPLRWCSKSLGKIAGALVAAGHQVSDRSAGKLLRGLGFRLHANQKTGRVRIILTAMRSFAISMRLPGRRSKRASQ